MKNKRQEVLKELFAILDVDNLQEQDSLEEFENWDSLAVLSIIVAFDDIANHVITREEVYGCTTVKELLDLLNEG